MRAPRVTIGWIAKLPQNLQFLVSDLEYSLMRARTSGANRRKRSRALWRRAVRSIEPVRAACLAPKANWWRIARLVGITRRLFDAAAEVSRSRDRQAAPGRATVPPLRIRVSPRSVVDPKAEKKLQKIVERASRGLRRRDHRAR